MATMTACAAVLLFALANGAWLMHRLATVHPATWRALGRPTFALSTGITPRLALMRFIWSRRYRALNDAALTRCCRAAMVAEPLLAALCLYLILV